MRRPPGASAGGGVRSGCGWLTRSGYPGQLHAARSEVERQLAAIWSELLGVKEFSVTDNFFDLGGNSLLAMQVLARIRRAFQVEVSVRSLFDGPRPRQAAPCRGSSRSCHARDLRLGSTCSAPS